MMYMYMYIHLSLFILFLMIIFILMSVAFLTLLERKIMGMFHNRKGPNKVTFIGIFQPFSDAMKLLTKQLLLPMMTNLNLFTLSPIIMIFMNLLTWLIYPFMFNLITFNYSMVFLFLMISVSIYGLLLTGWTSNSIYSMIGSIRSIAQSISYEIIFSLTMIIILITLNSLDFNKIFKYQMSNLFSMFFMMLFNIILFYILISIIVEINRTPFDLSESESELVSGFNIEYSSMNFILIFLTEYSNMLFFLFFFSLLMSLNLNNWLYLLINMLLLIFFVTWTRMTLPRLRYDLLMSLCWMEMLSFSIIIFILFLVIPKMFLDYMIFL